jgi:hypothetical protein
MSNSLNILWIACTIVSMVIGCSRKDDTDASPHKRGAPQGPKPDIRSLADLKRLLVPGMRTNEIVAVFGKPRLVEDVGQTHQVWHYGVPPFVADDKMRGSAVVGITVGLTNGHLANWGVPNDHLIRRQEVLSDGKSETNSPVLKLFVVSTNPVAGGGFVDTGPFPKLGFISANPNLVIDKVKEVTLEERGASESQGNTVWSFGIFLLPEDAARLKFLTATNVGKRILLMVGNEPVSAPRVMGPLETGSFAVECGERSLMETISNQLARMVQPSQ